MKVYGPYTREDGRKHVILYDFEAGIRRTQSYPRYLMEQHLGRPLEEYETVDHIDEDFTNDDISNLQLLSREENARKSMSFRPAEMGWFTCPCCDKDFEKELRTVRHNQGRKGGAGPFCSRSCAGYYFS